MSDPTACTSILHDAPSVRIPPASPLDCTLRVIHDYIRPVRNTQITHETETDGVHVTRFMAHYGDGQRQFIIVCDGVRASISIQHDGRWSIFGDYIRLIDGDVVPALPDHVHEQFRDRIALGLAEKEW